MLQRCANSTQAGFLTLARSICALHLRVHGKGLVDDAPVAVVLEHREVVRVAIAEPVVDDLDHRNIARDTNQNDMACPASTQARPSRLQRTRRAGHSRAARDSDLFVDISSGTRAASLRQRRHVRHYRNLSLITLSQAPRSAPDAAPSGENRCHCEAVASDFRCTTCRSANRWSCGW